MVEKWLDICQIAVEMQTENGQKRSKMKYECVFVSKKGENRAIRSRKMVEKQYKIITKSNHSEKSDFESLEWIKKKFVPIIRLLTKIYFPGRDQLCHFEGSQV